MRVCGQVVQRWYILSVMATFQERDGRIRALIRLKGHPPISKTFRNKTLAKQWATKVEAAMLDGTHLAASKLTVRQLFDRYIKEVADDKWTRNYLLRCIREAKFVHNLASDCDAGIAAWFETRRKQVKADTVRREATVLSTVFRVAMRRWKVKLRENPLRAIELPPKGRPRWRRVSERELAAIWNHFGLGTPVLVRHYVPYMFEFACETGVRLEELTELEWATCDLEARTIYVPPSKNGDDRYALLTERAVELLQMLPRETDRVFPVNKLSVGQMFRVATRELGIKNLHFHDSRHEACTRLAKFLTAMELAKVIGHRNVNTLLIYYNPTPAELAAKLPGAGQPTPQRPSPTTEVCGSA